MVKPEIYPIASSKRIAIVDILRGWALIGVVLVNYFLFFYLPPNAEIPSNDFFSHFTRLLTDIFFTNKSRIMLNVLFGFGFATVINTVQQKGINPVTFFSKRMFWLFLIGLANTALYYGDFLKDYAVVGILMIPFHKVGRKASLYTAVLLLLIYPVTGNYFGNHEIFSTKPADLSLYKSHNLIHVFSYGFFEGIKELYSLGRLLGINLFVLSCFFTGQYLYKIDFFVKIINGEYSAKRMFWVSLSCTIFVGLLTNILPRLIKTNVFKHYDTFFWLEFGLMLVLMSSLCWIYKKRKLKRFFSTLEVVGKMTLSNYMTQNLLSIFLFSGFGLGLLGNIPLYAYILLAASVYLAQTYFSRWWLSKYHYGFVEWVWRQAVYLKRLPLKRADSKGLGSK